MHFNQLLIHPNVKFKKNYKFENGDESKAVYMRISKNLPKHLSNKLFNSSEINENGKEKENTQVNHRIDPHHPPA